MRIKPAVMPWTVVRSVIGGADDAGTFTISGCALWSAPELLHMNMKAATNQLLSLHSVTLCLQSCAHTLVPPIINIFWWLDLLWAPIIGPVSYHLTGSINSGPVAIGHVQSELLMKAPQNHPQNWKRFATKLGRSWVDIFVRRLTYWGYHKMASSIEPLSYYSHVSQCFASSQVCHKSHNVTG